MCTDTNRNSAIIVGLIVEAIVGTVIGWGTITYTDYQDDGELFNESGANWHENT